jgi:hypothetical protein
MTDDFLETNFTLDSSSVQSYYRAGDGSHFFPQYAPEHILAGLRMLRSILTQIFFPHHQKKFLLPTVYF